MPDSEAPPNGAASYLLPQSADVAVRVLRAAPTCANGVRSYHPLLTGGESGPKERRISCWHCCDDVSGETFVAPASVDEVGRYAVFGHFCSLECAKGHILEADTYHRSARLCLFSQMAREVYGRDAVRAMPPRVTLHRFGGPFSPSEFRSKSASLVRIVTTPFVSHRMFVEETLEPAKGPAKTGAPLPPVEDDFSEVPCSSAYDDFVVGDRLRAASKQDTPPTTADASSVCNASSLRRYARTAGVATGKVARTTEPPLQSLRSLPSSEN